MPRESTLRQRLIKGINEADGHAVAVENAVEAGTPDLNYCVAGAEGWLELKQVPDWPKGIDTVIRIEHYTLHQRRWIHRRQVAGGRAGLVLQVADEVFLFMDKTALVVGTLDEPRLRKRCTASWKRSIVWDEFITEITNVPSTK